MRNDPILSDLGILFDRFVLFIVLCLIQTIVVWVWFWMHFKSLTVLESLRYIANAWPISLDSFVSFQALTILWVSMTNTSIIYLLLGRWWKKRADVLHRRGSRFVDARDEV